MSWRSYSRPGSVVPRSLRCECRLSWIVCPPVCHTRCRVGAPELFPRSPWSHALRCVPVSRALASLQGRSAGSCTCSLRRPRTSQRPGHDDLAGHQTRQQACVSPISSEHPGRAPATAAALSPQGLRPDLNGAGAGRPPTRAPRPTRGRRPQRQVQHGVDTGHVVDVQLAGEVVSELLVDLPPVARRQDDARQAAAVGASTLSRTSPTGRTCPCGSRQRRRRSHRPRATTSRGRPVIPTCVMRRLSAGSR